MGKHSAEKCECLSCVLKHLTNSVSVHKGKLLNTFQQRIENSCIFLFLSQGMTLLMMGSADALPEEPAVRPMFVEDMTEEQLASAVSKPENYQYC